LSDLSVLYKNYISEFDKKSLIDFVKEISKYAKLYRELIPVFDKSTVFSGSDNPQRLFHILDVCEISTFHPYVLFLLNKYTNDPGNLEKKLYKFEKFVIRRMITKQETKSYNKVCKEFINDEASMDGKINSITDLDVERGLQNISNKNAALLLFWAELFRRKNDGKYSLKDLKYDYSLEHVMPQKWKEHWSGVPVKDNQGNT